ncbi:hypothetical protein ACFSL6_27650 [Paenibacillus thailandensis]|uniref:Uncharacterized protein n=1 Tax=Paenibacillus thailandensis TaxID=393250 RepID=A0ABW5R4Q3_9BACL
MTNQSPVKLKTHFKKDALRCVELLRKSIAAASISDDAKKVINEFLKVSYGEIEDKLKIIIMSTYFTFLGKMDLENKEAPKNAELQEKLLKDLDMVKKALAPGKA